MPQLRPLIILRRLVERRAAGRPEQAAACGRWRGMSEKSEIVQTADLDEHASARGVSFRCLLSCQKRGVIALLGTSELCQQRK